MREASRLIILQKYPCEESTFSAFIHLFRELRAAMQLFIAKTPFFITVYEIFLNSALDVGE